MTEHVLRLFADRLEPGATVDNTLAAANRAIYVIEGTARITGQGAAATLMEESGWFHSGEVSIAAGKEGAHLLRYELIRLPEPDHGIAMGQGVASALKQETKLSLQNPDGYLMRCDKVELPPGGIAYTHTHRGPGIRCLLVGAFTVEVGEREVTVATGEAWFEPGPDPVYAYANEDQPAIFSRVMILPRTIKGQSSIAYVNAEDADKPKLQTYTVYIDEFIDV